MKQDIKTENSGKHKMGDEDLMTANKSNNITATVLMSMVLLTMLRRCLISDKPKANPLRGGFRLIALWMVNGSALAFLIYLGSLAYLTDENTPRRSAIELIRQFSVAKAVKIGRHVFDLSQIMIAALWIAEGLLISGVLIAVTTGTAMRDQSDIRMLLRCSVNVIPKLWAVMRLFFISYLFIKKEKVYDDIMIFMIEMISIFECVLASTILLVLSVKDAETTSKERSNSRKTLLYTLLFFCSFKYGVNLISFPFKITDLYLEVLMALQFGTQLGLYVSLSNYLCPLRETVEKAAEENTFEDMNMNGYTCSIQEQDYNEIPLISPHVEFDNSSAIVKRN